jgi:hypothetical protein
MSKVYVLYYPYDSEGVIAVYSNKDDAEFVAQLLNNKRSESRGSVEVKEMELK